MPIYEKGRILKLPENKYGAIYGIVTGIETLQKEFNYQIAVYTGNIKNCACCGENTFAPVSQKFKENELEIITGKEAESLRKILEVHGGPHLTCHLLHESEI